MPQEPSETPGAPGETRVRTCQVCQLDEEGYAALNAALACAEPTREFAMQYGLGLSALHTHVLHRRSEREVRFRLAQEHARQAQDEAAAAAAEGAPDVSMDLQELLDLAVKVARQAEYVNPNNALYALRNVGRLLPLLVHALAVTRGEPVALPHDLLPVRFDAGRGWHAGLDRPRGEVA